MIMQSKLEKDKHVRYLPIRSIVCSDYQARKIFSEKELIGLAQSIQAEGILQPLSVRKTGRGEYELIAGERRLRAAKLAGLQKVPCLELHVDDDRAVMLSLIENIQRQELHFFEEAEALSRLLSDCEMTQQEVADRIGKSQSTIANKLRLLRLTPPQRQKIIEAGLTERHARVLLKLDDWQLREKALNHIVECDLNVADAENYIARFFQEKQHKFSGNTVIVKDVRLFFNTINRALDTMRRSGIAVEEVKGETEQFIEYTVRIPKTSPPIECSA